ncbi:adenylyl-sulfate kinase, partial [bacterium]|nr:adenylyl-sulfate kinase [bacterium]
LYKKARAGEIKEFTGISSPFEIGTDSIILKNNKEEDLEKNISLLIDILNKEQKINLDNE